MQPVYQVDQPTWVHAGCTRWTSLHGYMQPVYQVDQPESTKQDEGKKILCLHWDVKPQKQSKPLLS